MQKQQYLHLFCKTGEIFSSAIVSVTVAFRNCPFDS